MILSASPVGQVCRDSSFARKIMRNQMKKRLSKSGIYIGRKMPNDGKGIREQMSQ